MQPSTQLKYVWWRTSLCNLFPILKEFRHLPIREGALMQQLIRIYNLLLIFPLIKLLFSLWNSFQIRPCACLWWICGLWAKCTGPSLKNIVNIPIRMELAQYAENHTTLPAWHDYVQSPLCQIGQVKRKIKSKGVASILKVPTTCYNATCMLWLYCALAENIELLKKGGLRLPNL